MKAATVFSNNIRSNIGYTVNDDNPFREYNYFHQQGRKVFKEVCPLAASHIQANVAAAGIEVGDVKRWWLHQANININMNQLIAKKLLGRVPDNKEAPTVLDTYANTASAGSLIALTLNHEDLAAGDYGVLCSFGAGYSIGSLVLRKR